MEESIFFTSVSLMVRHNLKNLNIKIGESRDSWNTLIGIEYEYH